ncbi:hypothetical protein EDC04DRAFT_2042556 [Pisolithus marmoratus]|nr:hypothetical protein EDC04DRAFT_2042556 [Pisolithus marmoratus]
MLRPCHPLDPFTNPSLQNHVKDSVLLLLCFLGQVVSRTGSVGSHKKCSDYGASGPNDDSAVSLSPPLTTARPRQQLSSSICQPPTTTTILTMPMWAPMTDRSLVVTSGWKGDDGIVCGNSVTSDGLVNHLAAVHCIKNMASDIEFECRLFLP